MAVTTKAKGGREDLQFYDGKTKTFTRVDSSGGTQTITKMGDYVDALQVYGSGTSYTRGTLQSAITAIGSTNAELFVSTGEWTIDDNITFPSNITLRFEHGAYFTITAAKTVTVNGPLIRTRFQIFQGSGSYSLSELTKNSLPVVEHSTTATATADDTLLIGEVVRRKEYATGKGVIDALDDVVAAATGTDDGFEYHDSDTASLFQLKLRIPPVVDVKLAGAYADGSTDCFSAIEAIKDWIPSTGAVIHFTRGSSNTYLFSLQSGSHPSITWPSNTTILIDNDVLLRPAGSGSGSGVNTYGDALFTNSDQTNGNDNIHIRGGQFRLSGSSAGSSFIAFKRVTNFSVKECSLLDVDSSCRMQFSRCSGGVVDDIYTNYVSALNATYSFEDGIRIGSGCNNINMSNLRLNSGDDAIAINNEPAEVENGTTGADISNININNVHVTTLAGHAVRIYHEATMTSGIISGINISNLTGTVVHTVDGISIGNYATGPTMLDINFHNVELTTTVDGAGCLILDADYVTFTGKCQLNGFDTYGFNINSSTDVTIHNPKLRHAAAGASSVDLISIGNASHRCKILGGNLADSLRDGIRIGDSAACNDCIIDGVTISNSTGRGVYMTGSSLRTQVINNIIPSSTDAAIEEASGCNYSLVQGNNVVGATAIDDSAAGANSIYKDNIGFNPRGTFSISPGASPYTYTAGTSPEFVTVYGGTVSQIDVNSNTTGATSGGFRLPPHSSLTVTYSSAPTMWKTLD